MRIFTTFALVASVAVAGCSEQQWNGTGTQVGTVGGKALFQTDCKIDTSAVGGKALWGQNKGKPVPNYYACQPQAKATCDGAYTITKVTPGARRPQTSIIDNGFQRIRRRYIEQDMSIQYTCD